ncbi:hypothetical protein [uncultured Pontibacter sp.]|uniref:hypothetical protein n=1 Tax=uncultured Pontibacter sp. TaxID=453356 RepID=UPI00261DC3DC|nr:hypothetical protein [uncultured Pontibacter sp.]
MKIENDARVRAYTRASCAGARDYRSVDGSCGHDGKAGFAVKKHFSVFELQPHGLRTLLRIGKLRAHRQLQPFLGLPETGKLASGVWGFYVRKHAGNYSFQKDHADSVKILSAQWY